MLKKILQIFNKTEPEKQKILIFCGAGISQESGLNTFRDSNGIWENHSLEEVCNYKTFRQNKGKVFEFYNERKKQILMAEPNIAHKKIAQIQQNYGIENVLIFTSNIDNLLNKAGCKNVVHVHGDISHMLCTDCQHQWHIGDSQYNINHKCPQCSSEWIKPSVVFFYETAPKYKELHLAFEMGGPIIGNEIVNHIRVVIGTSFQVIRPDIFNLHRGNSIVVDKNFPQLDEEECSEIIVKPATQGMQDVENLIKKWYKT